MVSITLRSNLTRRALMFVEVIVFVGLGAWIVKNYFADRWGRKVVIADLERAIKFDPDNSDYQLRLGQQRQYNITEINPDLAMAHLKRATELSPRDPAPWLELSAAYNFQGNAAAAETCLRRADVLAPNLPHIQWVIGNFFLLQGNIDEALRHFKVVLAGSSQYQQILFKTAWKAVDDNRKILNELIPRQFSIEIDYLYFLLSQKKLDEAEEVWKRIATGSQKFAPELAGGYIDTLLTAHRLNEASHVWDDLRSKGLIKPTYQPTASNLVVNGDFEEDLLKMGFDWRVVPMEGIYAGVDTSTYHSPSRALLIRFSGKQNIDYHHVYQFVRVEPGRTYRLQGFLKTEGITTDSGPRLEVRDGHDASQLQTFSESNVGTSGGWTQVILDFTAGAKTELVLAGVARLPSRKLDNLIAGKVWVDDVSLAPLPSEKVASR